MTAAERGERYRSRAAQRVETLESTLRKLLAAAESRHTPPAIVAAYCRMALREQTQEEKT